ncbi:MAG: hypothetical protein EHM70_00585 [Chloroflexota bacterium]|nr:MAG: hypothetical protein EHM70_00585 [Chloroflexota bacterium]
MKTRSCRFTQKLYFARWILIAIFILSCVHPIPALARPRAGTIPNSEVTSDTTWTEANSPYLIDQFVHVAEGVTLTIEAGVEVDNSGSWPSYGFSIDGTLKAFGTAEKPIYMHNSRNPAEIGRWDGIYISGSPEHFNQGSYLEYVILDHGGMVQSGSGANLVLTYAQADVHHCQFNNGTGDGILGNDVSTGSYANVYDSSFTNNAGYAINFEDGSVNPVLRNLTASGNGATLPTGGDLVVLSDDPLHGAHTWEYMGLPYLLVATTVDVDGVLTIEPGVQVLVGTGSYGLDVLGKLIANGTASQRIRFDPADPAVGWSGINIGDIYIPPSTGNQLGYVTITKGGYNRNCDLYVRNGDVTVTHSQFDSSRRSGVCLDTGAYIDMSDSQFTNNGEYPIDVWDAADQFTLDSLTATGSASNAISIGSGTLTGIHSWPLPGLDTIDINGSVTIAPTGTLNILPGSNLRFGEGRDMTIHGTLNAVGTSTAPITFTGQTATPGTWVGLYFEGMAEQPATGTFEYVTIEYGGYGGAAMIGIQNAALTFNHTTLRNSYTDAIEIFPSQRHTAGFKDVFATVTTQINWSSLYNIGRYAINNSSNQAILAAFNWWGSSSGPKASGNPGGTGSAINGMVSYFPYALGPNGAFIFTPLIVKR